MGTEALPTVPPQQAANSYVRTKVEAECMVLDFNGRSLDAGGTLRTCALRPTLIYGPNDQHSLPAMVQALKDGMPFTLGSRQEAGIADFVYGTHGFGFTHIINALLSLMLVP